MTNIYILSKRYHVFVFLQSFYRQAKTITTLLLNVHSRKRTLKTQDESSTQRNALFCMILLCKCWRTCMFIFNAFAEDLTKPGAHEEATKTVRSVPGVGDARELMVLLSAHQAPLAQLLKQCSSCLRPFLLVLMFWGPDIIEAA